MKRETLFLKVALFLLGIPVLALCIFGVPVIAREVAEYLEMTFLQVPLIIGLYVAAIAYFAALYQAFRLLNYIDKNNAFSELSVRALQRIKYCAITISILFVVKLPIIYLIADKDDAPGLIIIGLGFIFAPIVIAVFAAVLQKLLKNAIDIKSENDLTV